MAKQGRHSSYAKTLYGSCYCCDRKTGKTPVLTNVNPLYAICKQLQLQHKDTLGEDKVFLKIGDLHIEIMIVMMQAVVLCSYRWAEALSESGITTPGRAESLASSTTDVNLAAYVHQVTYVAVYILMKETYWDDMKDIDEEVSLDEWRARLEENTQLLCSGLSVF